MFSNVHEPQLETIKLDCDPLACVVHWEKTNADLSFIADGTPMSIWCTMLRSDATQLKDYRPDMESKKEAEKIRTHYRSKLGMRAIANENDFTDYQKKLGKFISINFKSGLGVSNEMPLDYLGLVVRLPQMYKEDMIWLKLEEKYSSAMDMSTFGLTVDKVMSLQYIDKFNFHNDVYGNQYFFTKDNEIYVLKLQQDNILTPLLRNEIKAGNGKLTITGLARTQSNYGSLVYWDITSISNIERNYNESPYRTV
jgi:hypothetical protein